MGEQHDSCLHIRRSFEKGQVLPGRGRPTLGPKDGRGEVKAQRSINISFAATLRLAEN